MGKGGAVVLYACGIAVQTRFAPPGNPGRDRTRRPNRNNYYRGNIICPMCAAAHGWVGLGRIVYISSSNQLVT